MTKPKKEPSLDHASDELKSIREEMHRIFSQQKKYDYLLKVVALDLADNRRITFESTEAWSNIIRKFLDDEIGLKEIREFITKSIEKTNRILDTEAKIADLIGEYLEEEAKGSGE